ncbi:MAG: zinc ribbon domain-containing protein [Gammaproteobacteria bacterium]|nr:zinc ribbon domain-containing protein [Gammaproteobacteria bacterium]MDH5651663.1 zinc ribbon domain-containing protein [Gammaproteobacteria bacterium]
MPTYDYHCDANGRTVEVKHGMNEKLFTWGELCERAGIDIGDTPVGTDIRKLATGGQVMKGGNMGSAPPCGSCCGGGVCGH